MKATRLAIGVTVMCAALAESLPAQAVTGSSAQAAAVLHQAGNITDKLQDDIAAGRWDAAQKKLFAFQRMVPTLDSLEQVAEAGGRFNHRDEGPEFPVFIDSLANRLEDQRRLPALTSANAVGRALLPLVAAFSTPAQLAVAHLDVAARDLRYTAEQGSWAAARSALREIRETYAAVQPQLVQHAPNLNATIERRLADLAGALQSHLHVRARALAGEFLEDVDLIQSTFTDDH
ncbi:MAG: hypothetical protein P8099_08830 [Gemmatimonadota bacterium]|jgi:hypothetical protein